MQKDLVHAGGVEHREVHNAFGMYYHAATAEGIARRNDERPFVLSRAFFRRDAANRPDLDRRQRRGLGPPQGVDPDADDARADGPHVLGSGRRRFLRQSRRRAHDAVVPDRNLLPLLPRARATWRRSDASRGCFGSDATRTIRDAIRRRYQLMPYLYTLFEAAHREGSPVLRPLWYEFPDDPSVWAREDAVMLGPRDPGSSGAGTGRRRRRRRAPRGCLVRFRHRRVSRRAQALEVPRHHRRRPHVRQGRTHRPTARQTEAVHRGDATRSPHARGRARRRRRRRRRGVLGRRRQLRARDARGVSSAAR